MFVEYCGRRLIPTRGASRELQELGLEPSDVLEVLEGGFDCASGGRRAAGITEKCLRKEDKLLRVVVAEGLFPFPGGFTEDVYYLIHVSQETWKPERWR